MKIIDKEEREAHKAYVVAAGLKGMFYGSIFSIGLFAFLKARQPVRFNRFNTSIKTAILTMPTISSTAFFADEGSVEFDRKMYSSGHTNQKVLEEFKQWKNASTSEKIVTFLSTNKYKIILSTWIASLYGSWILVNRDKIMTKPQKLVQARMYAQAITIVLLLSTIVLSMKEEEMRKSQPAPLPEWKKVLLEKEQKSELGEQTGTEQ